MSDKTNEEKLRILQERLTQIQNKKEIKQEERFESSRPVAPVFEEDLVNEDKPESNSIKQKNSPWKIIFFLILFAFLAGFGYYSYNNNFKMEPIIDNIEKDFDIISTKVLSLFGEEDKKKKKKKHKKEEVVKTNQKLVYYKSEFDGNFMIILKTFDKEKLANAEAQNLTNRGYNCDVLQLSGVSNSEEEIFQTYIKGKNIGVGFETKEEALQHLNSTEEIQNSGEIIRLQ